jgi:hypothetical protein
MLQRTLPAGFIAPCLPSKTDKLPSGSQWLHEIKHDGFRIIASNCKIEVLSVFQDKGRDSRQSTFRVDEACRGF